jgi:hypothetical protein
VQNFSISLPLATELHNSLSDVNLMKVLAVNNHSNHRRKTCTHKSVLLKWGVEAIQSKQPAVKLHVTFLPV